MTQNDILTLLSNQAGLTVVPEDEFNILPLDSLDFAKIEIELGMEFDWQSFKTVQNFLDDYDSRKA